MPKSLPVPAAAKSDPHSMEMIRVWIANQSLHTALNIGFWKERELDEPDAWGILLADVVRHIAGAHEDEYGCDPRETCLAIRAAFERELAKPTSEIRGSFIEKQED